MVKMIYWKNKMTEKVKEVLEAGQKKDAGIDGILVTIGLCVIALLLCVVMKNSLSTFITTIVKELTKQAKSILTGGI